MFGKGSLKKARGSSNVVAVEELDARDCLFPLLRLEVGALILLEVDELSGSSISTLLDGRLPRLLPPERDGGGAIVNRLRFVLVGLVKSGLFEGRLPRLLPDDDDVVVVGKSKEVVDAPALLALRGR